MLSPSASVSYAVDPDRTTAPAEDPCAGTRLVDDSLTIGGQAVDPAKTYRVTVDSLLAGGGGGFTTLRSGRNTVTGGLDLDALVAYLRAVSPVPAPALDRVRTTGEAVAPAA